MKLNNNKLRTTIFALSVSAFSLSALADLTVPGTVDILALNGKKIEGMQTLSLSEGRNQLVIRYTQVLRQGSKQKRYQSKPYVTVIDVVNSDDEMEITHRYFSRYDNAKVAFATNRADWSLTVNEVTKPLAVDELPGKPGFLPYRDIEKLVAQYNINHGPEVKAEQGISLNTDSPELQTAKAASSGEFIKEIKQWYKNASDAERKAMLTWMIEQQ